MGTRTTATSTEHDHIVMELEGYTKELLSFPSSTKDFLPSLDKLEDCLMRATQTPPDSIQRALCPLTKALASKELLNHLNVDVRVSVASCFSQILRIIAPDVPFDDELMKEIFRVIVSALDKISEVSSLSYHKRVSILATVAEIRSFILMLDLECDALIVDMFNYFLRHIREYHPDIVFSSMGLIMILVLEEMDEVPIELLSTLLDSVRTKNQDIPPIARTLGERVIENCDLKLAPYMHPALCYMGFPLKDYSKIVAHVCGLRCVPLEDDKTANSQDNASGNHPCINELILNTSTPGQDRCLSLTDGNGSNADDGRDSRKHSSADEFSGQVAKTEARIFKRCTTLPEASSYSLMKEAHGTSEPKKACNEGGQDDVMNKLGGKQPENICVEVHGKITKDRNSACQLLSAKQLCVEGQNKCGKDNSGEYFTKEMVSGIKSTVNGNFPRSRVKRNRHPEKGKTVVDLVNGMPSGANLIGLTIKVWWPKYRRFYVGVIDSYDPVTEKHKVLYADGDEGMAHLREEYWRPVVDGRTAPGGQSTHLPDDDALEMCKRKNVKTNSNSSAEGMTSNFTSIQEGGTSNERLSVEVAKLGGSSPDIDEDGSAHVNKSSKDADDSSGNHNHAVESKDQTGQKGCELATSAIISAETQKDHSFGNGAERIDNTTTMLTERDDRQKTGDKLLAYGFSIESLTSMGEEGLDAHNNCMKQATAAARKDE